MKIFRIKPGLSLSPVHEMPGAIVWNFDRAEMIADGAVHIFGVATGLIAATLLLVWTGLSEPATTFLPIALYAAGLLAMLGLSATYNLWPVSPIKWRLRRFDHSAIYTMIAATYTPFIVQLQNGVLSFAVLVGMWAMAIAGVLTKLVWPGRFDRLAISIYLLMGWSGLLLYREVAAVLPPVTLVFIVVGGALYSLGVIFHVWERLRFQNAIWHGFVLAGASCHYVAVFGLVLA